MTHFWPETSEGVFPPLIMMICYGYVLLKGSQLIGDGSEILLEIYGSGIVGGILIPILGAVPDGLIILFSGMGSGTTKEIEDQLAVGVGTLAGSTIMLLTVPLAMGIYLSRRELGEDGHCKSVYTPIAPGSMKLVLKPVVPKEFSWTGVGATALPSTPKMAKWMMLCSFTYLFIQVPAFFYAHDTDEEQASHEKVWAAIGLGVGVLLFLAYLIAVYLDEDHNDLVERRREKVKSMKSQQSRVKSMLTQLGGKPDLLFDLLDSDKNEVLDAEEVRKGFTALGFDLNQPEAQQYFNMMDVDSDFQVDRDEFRAFMNEFLENQATGQSMEDMEDEELDYLDGRQDEDDSSTSSAFRGPTIRRRRRSRSSSRVSDDSYMVLPDGPASLQSESGVKSVIHTPSSSSSSSDKKEETSVEDKPEIIAQVVQPASLIFSRPLDEQNNNFHRGDVAGEMKEDLLELLTKWHQDSEEMVPYSLEIGAQERYLVHMWASRQKDPEVLHYSTQSKSEAKGNGRGLRCLRLAKKKAGSAREIRVIRGNITMGDIKKPFYTDQPRWASASSKILKWARSEAGQSSGLRGLFAQVDSEGKGEINVHQMIDFANEWEMGLSKSVIKYQFYTHDHNLDRSLSAREFRTLLEDLVVAPLEEKGKSDTPSFNTVALNDDEADEEEEEHDLEAGEEHEDDGMEGWSEGKKKAYAWFLLFVGTGVVMAFSDPMVEVIGNFGDAINVPAFYVSFVVTPLASNASEVVASMLFAKAKTNATLGLTLSALYGAATMNSTFCLSIFLGLVYGRHLSWNFSAEVISILVVSWIVGLIGLRRTHTMLNALFIAMLFPLSIGMIILMEHLGLK